MIRPIALLLTALVLVPAARPQEGVESPSAPVPAKPAPIVIPAEARAVLESAGEFELLALHPHRRVLDGVWTPSLHGHEVLGIEVARGKTTRALLAEIEAGIAASDGKMAKCFMPRHGLRAKHGGKTVELVICYECLQLRVYLDGKRLKTIPTANSVEPAVSRIYEAAGLKIEGREGRREEGR